MMTCAEWMLYSGKAMFSGLQFALHGFDQYLEKVNIVLVIMVHLNGAGLSPLRIWPRHLSISQNAMT